MKHQPRAGETFEEAVQRRRVARMDVVDSLPPEVRKLIHEFGLHLVEQFGYRGITDPARVRHLVSVVLKEVHPLVGSSSSQGQRQRHVAPPGWKLVPEEPTEEMIAAMDLPLKHRRRYQAMLAAAPPVPQPCEARQ